MSAIASRSGPAEPEPITAPATPTWTAEEAVSRGAAVLGVAGIAVIHVLNAADAFHSVRYLFWLYMGLVAAAVPTIALLLGSRSARAWLAPAVLAIAPILGYLWSRAIGLPGDRDDTGDWLNTLGITSLFVETTVLTLSAAKLARLRQPFPIPTRRRTMPTSHVLRRSTLLTGLLAGSLIALALVSATASASTHQTLRISARANMVLRFNTARLHARAGRITIVMRNPSDSGMDHGIAISGHGLRKVGRTVSPGHSSSITLTLRRGSYTYYCPVPGHEQAGMKGTLTVS